MNLPNKLTVIRICMIPFFIIMLTVPLNWGVVNLAGTSVAWTQVIAMVIFAVASITDWLDGKIARDRGLVQTLVSLQTL